LVFTAPGQSTLALTPVPSHSTRKVSVMAFRSEADLQAAKAQAAR